MDLSNKLGRREQGQRIQRAVERAGLSIEELAGRIGCSRALIYQYLAGSTLSQPDRLQQIAAECGVPLTYFYSETDPNADVSTDSDSDSSGDGRTDSVSRPHPGIVESADVAERLNQTLRSLNALADAQEGPPDYRELASTCERIYLLAGQVGDRLAQAKTQFRLGNACLRMADFHRASTALRGAIDLARDLGEKELEADARQSLGNVLVSLGNFAEARVQFEFCAAGKHTSGRWKGTLSLGSVNTLYGEYRQAMERFDEAAAIIDEAEAARTYSAREASIGMLYVNGNRTNVYINGGDFETARPIIQSSLLTAEAYGIADEHLEARLDLAICDFYTGRWSSAYRGLNSMLQLSRFVGDQGRETMARAWLGILQAASGDFGAAIGSGKDALSMALSRGDRRAELYSQIALADAYTGQTNRESEARYHANQALAVAVSLRMERGEAECRLRAARLAAQCGDVNELIEASTRALLLAQKLGARHIECIAYVWLAVAHSGGSGGETEIGATPEAIKYARQALELAQNLSLSEGIWRSGALLGTLEQSVEPFGVSIDVLEGLRAQLQDADIPDTLLENEECLVVYADYIAVLRRFAEETEVRNVLEQAGWPPLDLRVQASSPPDSVGT